MNIVDDFINKEICLYDGARLSPVENTLADLECPKCNSYFHYIDSMGADGYYYPREPKIGDFCLKNLEEKK